MARSRKTMLRRAIRSSWDRPEPADPDAQRGFDRAKLRRGQARFYELLALEREVKRQRDKNERKRRRPKSQRVTDANISSAWKSTNDEQPRNRVSATVKKLELDGTPISKQALRKRLYRLKLLPKTT